MGLAVASGSGMQPSATVSDPEEDRLVCSEPTAGGSELPEPTSGSGCPVGVALCFVCSVVTSHRPTPPLAKYLGEGTQDSGLRTRAQNSDLGCPQPDNGTCDIYSQKLQTPSVKCDDILPGNIALAPLPALEI